MIYMSVPCCVKRIRLFCFLFYFLKDVDDNNMLNKDKIYRTGMQSC